MPTISSGVSTITFQSPPPVYMTDVPCDPTLEKLLVEHVYEDIKRHYGYPPKSIQRLERVHNHSSYRYRVTCWLDWKVTGWIYVRNNGEVVKR